MKIDTHTMLEAFDETGGRGDALTLSRESLVALAGVPAEVFAPIFHRLFQWFVSGDDTPLADPLANALLEGMKEHQRKNATKRRAYLVAQAEKGRRSAEQRSATVNRGQPRSTKSNQAKAKAEAKDISVSDSISFASGAVRKERAGRAALAPALSVSGARRFLAMNAPQVCSLEEMQNESGKANAWCLEFLKADLADAVRMVGERVSGGNGERNASTFDQPIMNVILGSDSPDAESAFRRSLAKAMVDAKNDDVKNPPAFIIARINKCAAALAALNAKGTRQ